MVSIIGVGDIMPGGILSGINDGFYSEELINTLNTADIRIGTLETAIGDTPSFNEEKMNRLCDVIYAKDQDLKKLKHFSIDVVSLANNHFYDLGPEGALHAINLLNQMGIKHVGAGINIQAASAPAIFNVEGETVAILAFCDWRDETVGWCPFATTDKMGVNPMYDDYVVEEIKKYKAQNDYVVVMPHWGKEHTWITTPHVFRLARKMIKAGADLILGSHPHHVQPVVNYKGASVAFSMGNFMFPDRLITKPRSTYYPEEPIDISLLPVTEGYPYVEEVTYKKWKPMANVGMIVKSELYNSRARSFYNLTLMGEDGVLTLLDDKESRSIERVLSIRERMLRMNIYPFLYQVERIGRAIFRRIRLLFNL